MRALLSLPILSGFAIALWTLGRMCQNRKSARASLGELPKFDHPPADYNRWTPAAYAGSPTGKSIRLIESEAFEEPGNF